MSDIKNSEVSILIPTSIKEDALVEKLNQIEPNEKVIYQTEGVIAVKSLREIANTLRYEVQILVSSDFTATYFIPGSEHNTFSNLEKQKFGFDKNVICDIHNHPRKKSLPSPSDLHHGMRREIVYISIGIDGVTERKIPKNMHLQEALYIHLTKTGETPWRSTNNYDKNLNEKALTNLQQYPEFDSLSNDRKHVELERHIRMLDYTYYDDFFNQAGRDIWEPYMATFLDSQNPPLIKHFAWDQEQEIESLLRGKTSL